jgi:hypothetical protein
MLQFGSAVSMPLLPVSNLTTAHFEKSITILRHSESHENARK